MELQQGRDYSSYASETAVNYLNDLLTSNSHESYQNAMVNLGHEFGRILDKKIDHAEKCLIAATAEDADYLASGLIDGLKDHHEIKAAIFWNHHYSLKNSSTSVAPIVHKFLEPGFESARNLILVKSVLSGSCVVRTNLISLIEKLNVRRIFIVAPVVHSKSEDALRDEFPEEISSLFEFIYFAKDKVKDDSGELKPGIGGQVYKLLGIKDQPSKNGYMPKLVERLVF